MCAPSDFFRLRVEDKREGGKTMSDTPENVIDLFRVKNEDESSDHQAPKKECLGYDFDEIIRCNREKNDRAKRERSDHNKILAKKTKTKT